MTQKSKANKEAPQKEITIALAGNPNVGKSTLFNALTGLHQHTGNWPGKTVASATGHFSYKGKMFRITDLPGTYSLSARSPEEEITRDQICFGKWDRILLVTDATCLERNLPLVLQTLEISDRVILCVNLMDEAKRRGIHIDLDTVSERLGIPTIGITASRKKTLFPLLEVLAGDKQIEPQKDQIKHYPEEITKALLPLQAQMEDCFPCDSRRAFWLAALLASGNTEMTEKAGRWCGEDLLLDDGIRDKLEEVKKRLSDTGLSQTAVETTMAIHRLKVSSAIVKASVPSGMSRRTRSENRVDLLLNKPIVGYPLMALAMVGIFYLTIRGADTPTRWLEIGLFWLGDRMSNLLLRMGCPGLLHDIVINGAWRMLAWVVSVMLPPMLIFFPLFTFLEDLGYLPRVAFALDRPFHRCGACGKQALTMAMGIGCNAVGVTGCRIIDSPRERLMAILTNSFIPCNGRFPMMILISGLFLSSSSFQTSLILGGLLLLAIFLTVMVTGILSKTILKGKATPFILELPPFRRPQLGQILVRSMLDRVGAILGRAAAVAAPAGVLIWGLSNVRPDGVSLLQTLSDFMDPVGLSMGLDGTILLAFLLGSSANETVVPIALMIYSATNHLSSAIAPSEIREILLRSGWNWATAVSVLLFTLLHWPCTTTLLTIRKETGHWKWALLAALLPTGFGIVLCTGLHWILFQIK